MVFTLSSSLGSLRIRSRGFGLVVVVCLALLLHALPSLMPQGDGHGDHEETLALAVTEHAPDHAHADESHAFPGHLSTASCPDGHPGEAHDHGPCRCPSHVGIPLPTSLAALAAPSAAWLPESLAPVPSTGRDPRHDMIKPPITRPVHAV